MGFQAQIRLLSRNKNKTSIQYVQSTERERREWRETDLVFVVGCGFEVAIWE